MKHKENMYSDTKSLLKAKKNITEFVIYEM